MSVRLDESKEGVILAVKAQPGARRNAVLGERGGALRVSVTAPPERGQANEAVAEVLARSLGLKGHRVRLVSGASSREKRFLIEGIDAGRLSERLAGLLPPAGGPGPGVG